MQQEQRSKLCKLQNKPGGETVYIVYENIIRDSKYILRGIVNDFAGLFNSKEEADQVATCLNNIFSKLHDEKWELFKPYTSRRELSEKTVWAVESSFKQTIQAPFKVQKLLMITFLKQRAKYFVKYTDKNYKIVEYRINDILPTMYLDDYNKTLHNRKFKHVINQLADMPSAQKNRQWMRRTARKYQDTTPRLTYDDSSDSEDESKWKEITGQSLTKDLRHHPKPKR